MSTSEPTKLPLIAPTQLAHSLIRFDARLLRQSPTAEWPLGSSFEKAEHGLGMKLYNLGLTIHRIKDEQLKILERFKSDGEILRYPLRFLMLDVETFFVQLRSAMDELAKLTPSFYSKSTENIPKRSFHDQKNWFLNDKRKDFDPGYTELLKRTNWFDLMKETRERFVHHAVQSQTGVVGTESGQFYLGIDVDIEIKGQLGTTFNDLDKILSHFVKSLFAFFHAYTVHFTRKVKETYPNFDLESQGPFYLAELAGAEISKLLSSSE